MPCDSAGAGLVSLGAMIRGLGNPNANDVGGHYEALMRYARQYLESCRHCDMRCDPDIKGCGYAMEVSGRVRYKGENLYTVSGRTDLTKRDIWFFGQGVDRWLNPRLAIDWQIEGEPLPELTSETGAIAEHVYDTIVEGAQIISTNLKRSFSGLCLAGRVAGKAASREVFESVRFRIAGTEYSLPNLLTVYEWNRSTEISRMTFFNTRTEELDRDPYEPTLIVADGDASFLKVLDDSEFQRSDVIAVIQRTIERDSLESIGNRLLGLRQWYTEDAELMDQAGSLPVGISIAILRRRFF